MLKILLVHGYSCGIKYSFFRNKRLDGSYKILKDDPGLKNQIKLFWWTSLNLNLSFWQAINPFLIISLYFKEKNEIRKVENQKKLYHKLMDYNPDIIIAHSMGCQYLSKTLEKFGHNPTLKKIVFMASDDDFDNHNVFKSNLDLDFLSYNCFWDYTLWLSAFINFKLRAGLFGYKNPQIKNIFAPELSLVPHNYFIASNFLKSKINTNFTK